MSFFKKFIKKNLKFFPKKNNNLSVIKRTPLFIKGLINKVNIIKQDKTKVKTVIPLINNNLKSKNNMSFFKKLFKKKPGGTFFGNLLRVGANKVSGGILGNGSNMMQAEQPQQQQYQQMSQPEQPQWMKSLGDKAEYLGGRASQQASVGVAPNTMLLLGGVAIAIVLILKNK